MKKFVLPPYYQTDQSVETLKNIASFKQEDIQIDQHKFRFVTAGQQGNPIILFIHGSPGSWTAWADYLADPQLEKKYFMIAVDRLGFGGSNNNKHEESVEQHSRIIMRAIEKFLEGGQKILVIGHSYGGPVALRIALDYPQFVKALGLLAPSISPALEKPQWYNKLAALNWVRAIIPQAVDHSNLEIMPLKVHLEEMEPRLSEVQSTVFVIQGKQDKLVPYQNAEFAKELMKQASVDVHLIEERGHFIPWQEYALVKKMIFKYMD